nr:MAG TPA: hypothetical protein [Caudoviricetes sp.]
MVVTPRRKPKRNLCSASSYHKLLKAVFWRYIPYMPPTFRKGMKL